MDLNQSKVLVPVRSKQSPQVSNMSFLRYFEGASPKPKLAKPAKRKSTTVKSPEQIKLSKQAYEETRDRKFLKSWKEGRPWLRFEPEEAAMYCDVCIENGEENALVRGSKVLRLGTLQFHEASIPHKRAEDVVKAKVTPVQQSTAAKALLSMKKAEHDLLVTKMRNAHAVAKHNLSFKTYEVLCRLDVMKNIDGGKSYSNDKACAQMCESIARTGRVDVVEKLKDCSFTSFTIDGSTDFMGDDLENIYVRTTSQCRVEDTFLYMGAAESACSEDIHTYVKGVFKTMGIEEIMREKLVGFCADGASNMQGSKGGLATLLKAEWPHLMTTHCLAHRLELAFKDAVKKTSPKLYEKGTTLLLGLYYLFRKSPKQKKGLERAFQALKVKQLLPTRIGGTRWLPHYAKALEVFTSAYKVFRYQLENSSHDNPKAEGLARLIRDGHLVIYLLALKRIISNLKKLSLYLQNTGISLADAYTRVMSTKNTLVEVVQSINKEDSSVTQVVSSEKYHDEALTFQGKKSPFNPEKMVTTLVEAMDKRFPPSELVSATMIISFRNWPRCVQDTYGNKEISVLFEQFCEVLHCPETEEADVLTCEMLTDEWSTLRHLIYQKYPDELQKKTLKWEDVASDLSDQELTNIFRLINLLLALPPTSVNNETAFSAMKLLKNKRRGRLATTRLNDLMTIKLTSPDIEDFDPEPAIADWMMSTPSGQKRRMKPRSDKKKDGAVAEDSVVVVEDSDNEAEAMASSDTEQDQEQQEPSTSTSSEAIQELMTKELGGEGEDDDDDDDNEMTEDVVFSLLLSFRD